MRSLVSNMISHPLSVWASYGEAKASNYFAQEWNRYWIRVLTPLTIFRSSAPQRCCISIRSLQSYMVLLTSFSNTSILPCDKKWKWGPVRYPQKMRSIFVQKNRKMQMRQACPSNTCLKPTLCPENCRNRTASIHICWIIIRQRERGRFHASRGGEVPQGPVRPDAQDFPHGVKAGISGGGLSYSGDRTGARRGSLWIWS